MNRFVFITHITPAKRRSSLRQKLLDLYTEALNNQTYKNWKVIQLGEEEGTDGHYCRFRLPDVSREEKTVYLKALFGRDDFRKVLLESDYIIKLDDDDLISPELLNSLRDFKGDLYYDRFHTFLDCSSGVITQQERAWFASTCVHKTVHALSEWKGEGASEIGNLLYTDHSKAWHKFYERKQIQAAEPMHPVYLRVLSPTSITAGAKAGTQAFADVDMNKYFAYLQSFGNWECAATKDFGNYLPAVAEAWEQFTGSVQQPLSKPGMVSKLLGKGKAFGASVSRKLKGGL